MAAEDSRRPGAASTGRLSARPRRLHVRYERAGRRPYSAAAAGGAKMTPPQIAEAQRMARTRSLRKFGPRLAWSPPPDLFCATKTAENRWDVGQADPQTPGLKF